jgi:hypothetical protein
MHTNLILLTLLTAVFASVLAPATTLYSQSTSEPGAKPSQEDLYTLTRFYNKSKRWGLCSRIKNMDRSAYNHLVQLHESYGLSTDYLAYTKKLTDRKSKWKERRKLNRNSYWDYELKPFLIRHQAIEYTPTQGARLDPGGTVRFQF